MRRHPLAAAVFILLMVCGSIDAVADYQVTGRFLYTDREYTLGGFTGNQPNLPIRAADVEVRDANTQLLLATGATDNNGNFSLAVVDNATRNLTVRALTSSNYTADLHMRVVNASSAVYAVAHPTFSSHAPTANIEFSGSPMPAPPSTPGNAQPGDPFNVFDVALDALNFIASVNGNRPGIGDALTLRWYLNSGDGTYYTDGTITVALLGLGSDSDGYDDSVIQHEVGHYAEFRLADSDNTGGFHQLDGCYVLPLAWSEGWSTFFQNTVRQWRGFARPDIYVDTNGQPGIGGAFISYSVETLPFVPAIFGSGNEVSVNAALWDAVDTPATLDATPGVDDDTVNIADGAARAWDVSVNYLPTVPNIQIEKFWDGWFSRGHGEASGMQSAFSVYKMMFFDDAYEPDDTYQTARDGWITDGSTDHTLYGVGDQDWTRYAGVTAGTYSFQLTTPLACGVSTSMSLFDSDGTTLLNSNPSGISWTATKNGALYLRVTRPGGDAYGNYELTVDINVPVVLTDVQLTSVGDAVSLAWHAQQAGAFSHFHVERSENAAGPYERRSDTALRDARNGDYLFVDASVEARTYWYRIVGFEESGESEAFGPYEVTVQSVQSVPPARLQLHPAQPNPFNPNTVLAFDLPQSGPVFVRVYSIDGRLVRTLVGGEHLPAGNREVTWDGRNDAGKGAASGMYIVRLESQGRTDTQRAVLVR